MRKALVIGAASSALLLAGSGTTYAAQSTVEVKIANKVSFDFIAPQVSQVSVDLKVQCDAAIGALALNVQVFQGNVRGFGFVPRVVCDGTQQQVVAHVQSNFGSLYTEGAADALVTDFARGTTFQRAVKIK